MIVEILETDKNLGIAKGSWYRAKTYMGDPSKISLLRRLSKKTLQPMGKCIICNQYRSEVDIIYRHNSIIYQ